jgi:hypothetical protein
MEASIMMAMMITTRQDGWQWRSPWSHGNGAHCDARGHTIHNIIDYMPVMFIFLSYYSFMLLHMVDVLIMIE